jgi:hypothetical protein
LPGVFHGFPQTPSGVTALSKLPKFYLLFYCDTDKENNHIPGDVPIPVLVSYNNAYGNQSPRDAMTVNNIECLMSKSFLNLMAGKNNPALFLYSTDFRVSSCCF